MQTVKPYSGSPPPLAMSQNVGIMDGFKKGSQVYLSGKIVKTQAEIIIVSKQ